MAFELGAKVRVYDEESTGLAGREGEVVESFRDGGAEVKFEGEKHTYPFDASELTLVNVTVIEGVLTIDGEYQSIIDNEYTLMMALREGEGKRIRITLEVTT